MWYIPLFITVMKNSNPTFKFAFGGASDFRGLDNTIFNILSSNGISFNMKTNDVLTLLPRPSLLKSSAFTEAYLVVKTLNTNETINISMNANEQGYKKHVGKYVLDDTLGEWKDTQIDTLRVLSKQVTNVIRANGWEINVTRTPVDFPLDNQTVRWRYNVQMKPMDCDIYKKMYGVPDTRHPHGLLGQSFDEHKIETHGEITNYDKVFIDQKEQLRGAIEGDWKDYIVESPFSTWFNYSSFYNNNIKRDISKLNKTFVHKIVSPFAEINDDLGRNDYKRKVQ